MLFLALISDPGANKNWAQYLKLHLSNFSTSLGLNVVMEYFTNYVPTSSPWSRILKPRTSNFDHSICYIRQLLTLISASKIFNPFVVPELSSLFANAGKNSTFLPGSLFSMAFPVVEFSREGYKIRKVFG